MSEDNNKKKKNRIPIVIITSIVGFIILVALIISIYYKETAFGFWHGIYLDKLFSSQNNINKNMSDEELITYANETDFCESGTIFDKMKAFLEDLTPYTIDSVCEGKRAIKSLTEMYEEKYESFNLKINPGVILAIISNTFGASSSDEEINATNSREVLEQIIKNNKISRDDIKNLVDHYVYKEVYDYYIWTIVKTSVKEETNPNTGEVIKKVTNTWGCEKSEQPSKNYYVDADKLSIFLRFGIGEIDFAGNTVTDLFGNTKDTPATEGYEYEKNMALSYQKTPEWCKKDGVKPVIPPNSEYVTNLLMDDYNSESIAYFNNKNFSEDSISNYEDYLQYADYNDGLTQDVFTPVRSSSHNKTFEISYENGFIFKKFSKFLGIYDSTITPKNIEYEIDIIKEVGSLYDSILGYGGNEESIGGLDGASIAEMALAMYYNNHDIYNNNNLCYISPDDMVRANTYNGIKTDGMFKTDCNGFIGLVLRAALGMGPSTGKNGGDVTFFSPSSYNGAWGPRANYTNDFELIKFKITTDEAYTLMANGELKPGDLIGFNDGTSTHIAVYVGEGKIVENTGPSESCGNGKSIKFRNFQESNHYNDGSKITIWRYKGISTNFTGKLPDNYNFGKVNVSACSLESYQIRLMSCSDIAKYSNYDFGQSFPGGYYYSEGRYYSKDTISVERYIKGLITSEISSGYELEAIKMQMILAKTYIFNAILRTDNRAGIDISSNELLIADGTCFQVYHDYKYRNSYLNSPNKQKVDTAYNSVNGVLITSANGQLVNAEFGAKLQNRLNSAAKSGATYIDMFENILPTYSKNGIYFYRGTILSNC